MNMYLHWHLQATHACIKQLCVLFHVVLFIERGHIAFVYTKNHTDLGRNLFNNTCVVFSFWYFNIWFFLTCLCFGNFKVVISQNKKDAFNFAHIHMQWFHIKLTYNITFTAWGKLLRVHIVHVVCLRCVKVSLYLAMYFFFHITRKYKQRFSRNLGIV